MGRSRGARLSLDRRHEATVDRVAAWQGCRDIDVRCGSVGHGSGEMKSMWPVEPRLRKQLPDFQQ